MSLVVYLLIAGGIELGRAIYVSQVLQDAARLGARELALKGTAEETFEQALARPQVRAHVFDADLLVIDLAVHADDLDAYFATLPIVNQALRPVFIEDNPTVDGVPRRLLRYPGALLKKASTPSGLTVRIPRVTETEETETIDWLPVVTEARANPGDPRCGPYGPFTLVASPQPGDPDAIPECAPDASQKGMVALVVNYPFQAAGLANYKKSAPTPADPNPPNAGSPKLEDDTIAAADLPQDEECINQGLNCLEYPDWSGATEASLYFGKFGLGRQFAYGANVRPFRKLLSGQAIFRREVFE